MKTYDIAYVDVTCLASIEEAIEHSCEIHRHHSGSVFGRLTFSFVEPKSPPFSLSNKEPTSDNFIDIKKNDIELFSYTEKVKEYKDFYKCFTDRLMAVDISMEDFYAIHGLINRNESASKDNFPSPRLRELVSSISDTLICSSFDYFTGIKFFSLRNEIIAFADYPVIKAVVEGFNPYTGKAEQAWGYFLNKPSYCLRFRGVKVPQV